MWFIGIETRILQPRTFLLRALEPFRDLHPRKFLAIIIMVHYNYTVALKALLLLWFWLIAVAFCAAMFTQLMYSPNVQPNLTLSSYSADLPDEYDLPVQTNQKEEYIIS